MKHFIGMGGLHGCMPDNCGAYRSQADAIGGLDTIYDLSDEQKEELQINGSTELAKDQGGQYCEVSECDCDSPWEHEEFGDKDDWKDEGDE